MFYFLILKTIFIDLSSYPSQIDYLYFKRVSDVSDLILPFVNSATFRNILWLTHLVVKLHHNFSP